LSSAAPFPRTPGRLREHPHRYLSSTPTLGVADEVRTAMVTRGKVTFAGGRETGPEAYGGLPGARLRLAPIEGHHGRWSSIRSRSRAGGRPATPRRPHVLRTRLALASLGWESDRFQSVPRPATGELGVPPPHNVRSRIRPGEPVRAHRTHVRASSPYRGHPPLDKVRKRQQRKASVPHISGVRSQSGSVLRGYRCGALWASFIHRDREHG
jgi:hypothetical protein